MERDMSCTWALHLPEMIHSAYNDPWTLNCSHYCFFTQHIWYFFLHKDKQLQKQCQRSAAKGCEEFHWFTLHSILSLFPISDDLIKFSYQLPSSPSQCTMTEQQCSRVYYEGCCWALEGAGVNYSITGWLSQELFKQTPVSRGLGLITPAKVNAHDPSPLPLTVGLSGIFVREIFIWCEKSKHIGRKKKRFRLSRVGRTGEGKKSKLASKMWLNSSGLPASPELSQGYNYPPKCPSVARLTSEAQVTLSPTEPNPWPSLATASPSSSSSRCLMALRDNDDALICRKDGLLEIRSMSVLHE